MTSNLTKRRRPPRTRLLGVVVLGALAVVVWISYTSTNGVPLTRHYDVSVDVASARGLSKAAEVRVGGVRVGVVKAAEAVPAAPGMRPHARLRLQLQRSVAPLPRGTEVAIRAASVLGANYVELIPGTSTATIRDGGRWSAVGAPEAVALTDVFDIFDRATARGMQGTITGLGGGFGGRGSELNAAIESLADLIGPLGRVSETLADPDTAVAATIGSYDRFAATLAVVREPLAEFIGHGADTFASLRAHRTALGRTIDAFPPAAEATTSGLRRVQPALRELARAARDLHSATPHLKPALAQVNATLAAGERPLRRLVRFAPVLARGLRALGTFGRARATVPALRKTTRALRVSDAPVGHLLAAQVQCNLFALSLSNFGSLLGTLGNEDTPSMANFAFNTTGASGEIFQSAKPSPDIGINYLPRMNYDECESGNEPYDGSQQLGSPPGLQRNSTRETAPPPGVIERAEAAGVLGPTGGER